MIRVGGPEVGTDEWLKRDWKGIYVSWCRIYVSCCIESRMDPRVVGRFESAFLVMGSHVGGNGAGLP
jgi:hypothetical protein